MIKRKIKSASNEEVATVEGIATVMPANEDEPKTTSSKEVQPTNSDFKINNLTITLLDLEKSSPVLAEKCITLDPIKHNLFYDFFKTHVEEARNGNNTRECTFTDNDNAILTKIVRYKKTFSEESFIKFANDITTTLFTIMKGITKSSGSFFIIDAVYKGEDFIVLIKLDPKDGVQLDLDSLDLKKIKNMLPESNDRVHKCALIKPTYVKGSTNLFVLDRQQKAGDTSKFFMSTFLQALPIPNNKMKTLAVLNELYEKITPNLPNVEENEIHAAIDSEFHNGATIHVPVAVKNIYSKLLADDIEDRDILLDQYQKEFLSHFTTKFKDYGTSFEVIRDENTVTYKADASKILFKFNKSLNNKEVNVKHDKTTDIYTITIKNNPQINFSQTIK